MGAIKKVAVPVGAALCLTGAGGGWALAAGSGGGVIHACANKRSHVLRLAKRCRRDERAVSWNRRGPQGPPGTVDTANFYTKTQSNSRYLPIGKGATGQSAVNTSGYALGRLSPLRRVTVDVGPAARHALIEADGDVWANPGSAPCTGYMQLSYNGSAQTSTDTSGTAPGLPAANGAASLTTSAMPLLAAGTQVVTLSASTSGSGCGAFQDARLNVVLLAN